MKAKNRFWWAVLSLLLLILSISCPFAVRGAAGGDAKVLKFGHVGPTDHALHLGALKMAELVKERTGGSIEVQVFPLSQLGNERDLIEGVQLGTVDGAIVSTALVANFVPEFGLYDLPFLFKDMDHVYRVLDGPVGQKLLKDMERVGLKGLAYNEWGLRHLITRNKKVVTPADLQGMKLRVMETPIYIDMFRSLGANPTPMAWGEVFTAVQLGVVDGLEIPIQTIYTARYQEVTKYIALTGHTFLPTAVFMNLGKFRKLPKEEQEILERSAKDAQGYLREESRKQVQLFTEKLREAGVDVYQVDRDEFRKILQPVYKRWEKEIGKDLIEAVMESR